MFLLFLSRPVLIQAIAEIFPGTAKGLPSPPIVTLSTGHPYGFLLGQQSVSQPCVSSRSFVLHTYSLVYTNQQRTSICIYKPSFMSSNSQYSNFFDDVSTHSLLKYSEHASSTILLLQLESTLHHGSTGFEVLQLSAFSTFTTCSHTQTWHPSPGETRSIAGSLNFPSFVCHIWVCRWSISSLLSPDMSSR